MALTVDATGIVTIWDCETTTGAVGNKPALDNEIFKENANSVDFTVTQNAYSAFNGTIPNGGNLSGQHVRAWYTSTTYPNMDIEANGGLTFYATDGTNTANWYIGGKDTYQGGWINAVIYLDSTPNSGSVNSASITALGFFITKVSTPKNLINTWVDYFRYGDGYTAYGTAWTFDDIYTADLAGGYGIVDQYEGAFFLYGALQIGRATEQTTLSEVGSVITFGDGVVNSTLYGITVIGQASSTFEFDGCVFTAAGTQSFFLDFDDTAIADFTFTGNTVQKASSVLLRNSSTASIVNGNTFDGCTTITTNLSTFNNNSIVNCSTVTVGKASTGNNYDTCTTVTVTGIQSGMNVVDTTITTTTIENVANSTLTSSGTGIGVDISGTAISASTSMNWTNTSSGFVDTAGNRTIKVQVNGTALLTIYNNSGDTIYYENSGTSTAGANGNGVVILTAAKSVDVHVQDAAGSPLQSAFVWANDGTTTITNTTTDSGGDIVQASYSGTSNSTLRVRLFGYKPYEATISTAAGNVAVTVTLVADAQQVAVPTLNNTPTITLASSIIAISATDPVGGSRLTNASTQMDSVQDFYEYVMNYFADTARMQYSHPLESATARDYSFVNSWTFTNKDTDYKYLYGGSIVDSANSLQWSNVKSIGSIYNNSTSLLYIVQGLEASNTVLNPWYPDGNIDVLVKVQDSTWIQSTSDAQVATNGGIWVYCREYTQLYDHFFVDLSPGGQSVIALSTFNDSNNQTVNTTVATYNDISITFGTVSRSLDGTNFYNYEVEIDCAGRPLAQVYEYLKYVTSYDYYATLNSEPGYDYRNASESTYSNVDSKQAPFGTYAGGKFFGAQGVFLTNMDGLDGNNYELIDTNGNPRTPPLTVVYSITNIQPGTEVRLYQVSDMSELAGRENVGGAADGGDNNFTQSAIQPNGTYTLTYSYTYSSDIAVYVVAHNVNYQWLRLTSALTNENGGVQIAQIQDRQYF